MTTKKRIISIVCIAIVFVVVAIIFIRGSYDWTIWTKEDDLGDVKIASDRDDIIKVREIRFDDDIDCYVVKLEPLKSGDVTFTVNSSSNSLNDAKYDFQVLPFGIVMIKGSIGSIGNIGILRIELIAILVILGISITISLYKQVKENRYSYKIMYYIGALVFIGFNALFFSLLFLRSGVLGNKLGMLLDDIVNDGVYFIFLLYPLVVILAIFLIISNIVLVIKEGRRLRNFLGAGLGLFLIGSVFIIDVVNAIFRININMLYVADTIVFGLLSYFECIMIGTYIATAITHRHVPKLGKDYIIILGCAMRKDGTPTPLLQGRVDRAIWFAKRQKERANKDIVFVCSGGQGSNEVISEAESMKNYLLSQGISEDQILVEDKSKSTYENMKFSKEIISIDVSDKAELKDVPIAFSTTDYHVFRSGNLAMNHGINVEGIGARTKWYFYVNALIREFVANLKAQRRRHIINIIIIFLICVIVSVISIMS